jgi:hypothetical protein
MNDSIIIIIAFGVLLAGSIYLVLNRVLVSDERRRNMELIKASKAITVPMRLQAYERLVLFLERISPDTLLLRVKAQTHTNSDLHLALLQQIRSEYEHNISQQLYVSDETWSYVKETKERIVMLINDLSKQTHSDGDSNHFAKLILDKLIEAGESPVTPAICKLKAEARKIL